VIRLSRSRVWVLVAFACLVLAIAGIAVWQRHPGPSEGEAAPPPQPVSVEVAPAVVAAMESTVAAQGRLMAAQGASARVASPIAGYVVEVRVQEGDPVTAGEILARVDNRALRAQTQGAAAAVAASEAQVHAADLAASAAAADESSAVRTARLTLESARIDREQAVKLAQTALDSAKTEFQKVQAGARPQEIAQAQQSVAQAEATRDRAATEADRVRYLFDHGVRPKRELDDAETALTVANSALESARQQLDLLKAGARVEDVEAAKLSAQQAQETLDQARASGDAHVAEAQAALEQAERTGPLQTAAKQQDARAAVATQREKRADLSAAQVAASTTVLRAPIRGRITRRALDPGDMADPSTPIVEIADTRALNLLADLPAEDGVKVRPGMRVEITATDIPDRVFSGQVLVVGQVDPDTNLMTIRIRVANPDESLRVGTYAAAGIVLRVNPEAIVVPKASLITRDGATVVFAVGPDGIAHQRRVRLGAQKGDLVEIVQGVAPGDQIICSGQYELPDGVSVRPSVAEPVSHP
jgi:HlyD family secretion protein